MPMTLKIRKSTWQPARSVRALEVWGISIYNLRQLTHKGSGIDI